MNVLITGGCGFLGSNIASAFLRAGEKVVVVDALCRVGSESNLRWIERQAHLDQLRHCRVDTADERALESVFAAYGPFDYICHLAGQVAMTTSLADPRRDLMTNVLGGFNVLECARKHCPNTAIAFSSTNKVYGDLRNIRYEETPTRFTTPDFPDGFDESLPLDFASPYGCSKGAADQYFRDWFRNYGLRTVVFRHSSIYGGRQFATYDQGWVGWFCAKALEQAAARKAGRTVAPFTISGTGKQVRDVLHADDLIALYMSVPARADAVAGEIFNIGGGIANSLSLLELFDLLSKFLAEDGGAAPLLFERLERRQSDQDVFVADIRKASALLGWKPAVSKEKGVEMMLEWAGSIAKP